MAEIITLSGQKFTNLGELKRYCDAQFITLQMSIEKIKSLESEIIHLKNLLISLENSKSSIIEKTPELVVCETQLLILEQRALQKELTLEEVKIFDLLVKNKKLLTENTDKNKAKMKLLPEYTDAELTILAQKSESKSE